MSALVGEGGFEPPKSETTDLQSAPFGHSGIPPYILPVQRQVILYHAFPALSSGFRKKEERILFFHGSNRIEEGGT